MFDVDLEPKMPQVDLLSRNLDHPMQKAQVLFFFFIEFTCITLRIKQRRQRMYNIESLKIVLTTYFSTIVNVIAHF